MPPVDGDVSEAAAGQELEALAYADAGGAHVVRVGADGDDVAAELAVAPEHVEAGEGLEQRVLAPAGDEVGHVELYALAVFYERAQQRVDAVAVAVHGDGGVYALLVHIAQAVADVGHAVEAAEAGELYELVEVARVELVALLLALILEVVEVPLPAQVVQRAEDEVVLRHGVDALRAGRVVVALAELEAEAYLYALGGLLHRVDELPHLALGELEALGAYLHGLLVAEVDVVGEAHLRYAPRELAAGPYSPYGRPRRRSSCCVRDNPPETYVYYLPTTISLNCAAGKIRTASSGTI